MSTVSNILCVYNPVYKPTAARLNAGGKIHATQTPQVVLQVFPTPKDAYIACCQMQRQILTLKRDRLVRTLEEDVLAYSYQRPSLMTYNTAKRVCDDISKITDPLVMVLRTMHAPSVEDVNVFSNMWVK
jgi:hypothetical protein